MMMIVGLKKLIRRYDGDVVMMSFRHIDIRMCDMFKYGCGLVLGILFFFGIFFWGLEVALGLSRLLFGKTQG